MPTLHLLTFSILFFISRYVTAETNTTETPKNCATAEFLGCRCREFLTEADENIIITPTDVECIEKGLHKIPDDFGQLGRFVLNNDNIPILHTSLNQYPTLTTLDLRFNQIFIISDNAFVNLSSLLHLDLSYNSIVDLNQYSLLGLSSLQTLNLRSNRLYLLESHVFTFLTVPSLLTLDVRESRVIKVEKGSLEGLKQLHTLNLAHNSIAILESLATKENPLNSLKIVDLSLNKIKSMDVDVFVNTPQLEELNLDNNHFTSVAVQDFTYIQNSIVSLSLKSNHISEVKSKAFKSLTKLKKLNLSSNFIEQLKLKSLPPFKLFESSSSSSGSNSQDDHLHVYIHDNQLSCEDCENAWMFDTDTHIFHSFISNTSAPQSIL